MIEVVTTEEFWKRYEKLPTAIQKKAEKQERIFRNNPLHPSLNTEKFEPKNKQIWSFRVDRKYRIFFRFLEKTGFCF
jgi:toxin HigB-1